jgi:hypothetical protein
MKKACTLALAVIGLTLPSVALAGEGDDYRTQDEKDGYSVDFFTDQLSDGGQGGTLPMILVRPRIVRMTLIRPRTSFVNEMLKSVEAI